MNRSKGGGIQKREEKKTLVTPPFGKETQLLLPCPTQTGPPWKHPSAPDEQGHPPSLPPSAKVFPNLAVVADSSRVPGTPDSLLAPTPAILEVLRASQLTCYCVGRPNRPPDSGRPPGITYKHERGEIRAYRPGLSLSSPCH